ncbi:MAG TPA: DUF6328 family protein [Candidatus Cybelea sp.]|nr:DUF6328 family protein [Candidatus Cybelea sp.]
MQEKLKIALDELRTLMLGAQVLFGFQFRALFEKGFDRLDALERGLLAAAILLMASVLGILIAGPAFHRLVEHGEATGRMLRIATDLAGIALLPFALSLGCDASVVLARIAGPGLGLATGAVLVLLALGFWYALALVIREQEGSRMVDHRTEHVPIRTKIDQMLTEGRVILPGAQALLGFQLIAMLTESFDALPASSKAVHILATIAVALAIVLLMTPAALHRLGFAGEASQRMLALGSRMITAALLPLGAGIAADTHVAIARITENLGLGAAAGIAVFLLLAALWYVWPLGVALSRKATPA